MENIGFAEKFQQVWPEKDLKQNERGGST